MNNHVQLCNISDLNILNYILCIYLKLKNISFFLKLLIAMLPTLILLFYSYKEFTACY